MSSPKSQAQRHSLSAAEWHEVSIHALTDYLCPKLCGIFSTNFCHRGDKGGLNISDMESLSSAPLGARTEEDRESGIAHPQDFTRHVFPGRSVSLWS